MLLGVRGSAQLLAAFLQDQSCRRDLIYSVVGPKSAFLMTSSAHICLIRLIELLTKQQEVSLCVLAGQ